MILQSQDPIYILLTYDVKQYPTGEHPATLLHSLPRFPGHSGPTILTVPTSLLGPADEHIRRILNRRIHNAIAGLVKIQREAITLYYIQGYAAAGIVSILNVPVGTIGRRLPDTRQNLREEMIDMARGMFKAVFDFFEITCERVIVDILYRDIFCALCCFKRGKKQVRLDSRPSDAIATAVRFDAGIFVEKILFGDMGMRLPGQREKKGKGQSRARRGIPIGKKLNLAFKSRRKFIWESPDPAVVEVTQEGVVHALKKGNVEIVATWKKRKG